MTNTEGAIIFSIAYRDSSYEIEKLLLPMLFPMVPQLFLIRPQQIYQILHSLDPNSDSGQFNNDKYTMILLPRFNISGLT